MRNPELSVNLFRLRSSPSSRESTPWTICKSLPISGREMMIPMSCFISSLRNAGRAADFGVSDRRRTADGSLGSGHLGRQPSASQETPLHVAGLVRAEAYWQDLGA